jgi:hypothetical protein
MQFFFGKYIPIFFSSVIFLHARGAKKKHGDGKRNYYPKASLIGRD